MSRRVQVGDHLRVLVETRDGVELEGTTRLWPGQVVDLVLDPASGMRASTRRACVVSWAVSRLGKDGTTYSGLCRWQ